MLSNNRRLFLVLLTVLLLSVTGLTQSSEQATRKNQQTQGTSFGERNVSSMSQNTAASKESCQQARGVWQSGRCYYVLKDRIAISKASSKVVYPTNVEQCQTLMGIWNKGQCYLPILAGTKAGNVMLYNKNKDEKSDAEKCKERGGVWVVNKDGQGFCFEYLKIEPYPFPRDTIK